DLRVARRPMLGLSGGAPLEAERAARLGVPVTEGLWLDGFLEGMGARAAGLQKDDVLVSLGGQPVNAGTSLASLLQGHRAGDRVPIDFYRGTERHTVTVELSARPMIQPPASAEELAREVRA